MLPILGATLLASCSPVAADGEVMPVAIESAAVCMQQDDTESVEPGAGEVIDEAAPPETDLDDAATSTDPTIIVTGNAGPPPGDPLAKINEQSYEVVQDIDAALIEPIAQVYEKGAPKPIRKGLRNFFRNLLEPVNFLNHVLQLKPGRAVKSLGRFAINSTVGVAGLVDVAKRKPFHLEYKPNGFANTLGYYGVGPGPYFYLPLVGSTTLRDALGGVLDTALFPTVVGAPFNKPWFGPAAYTITSLESRIEFDQRNEDIENSSDPYTVTRETYLCRRKADIDALRNRAVEDCSVGTVEARIEASYAPGVEIIPAAPPIMEGPVNDNEAAPVETQVPVIVLPDFDEPETDETTADGSGGLAVSGAGFYSPA